MSAVEAALYKWISGANEKREDLSFSPGLIEDSVALLLALLGRDYLEGLLVSSSEPLSLFDPDINPLRKWLKSSLVDQHIVQILEFAAYLRIFKDDPAIGDKIEKLKRDRFWPVFFELAMAVRMKTACQGSQSVSLNREDSKSVGDFTLSVDGMSIPCECTRLGHSPQVNEPHIFAEHLSNRIADATKSVSVPLVFKIRSESALTGHTYNLTLRLLRRCLADIKRWRLPAVYHDALTSVCCSELTPHSERVPFRMIDGVVTNVEGTDWESASSFKRVPAASQDEVTERFKAGERFHEFEDVRIFMKFGTPEEAPDFYGRLTNKLKKKLSQTKVKAGNYGKLVFIEVPSDLRAASPAKLKDAIAEAARSSRTTLGVVLANREPNPHYRHHYSIFGSQNALAFAQKPELVSLFDRFRYGDLRTDIVTGYPYQSSWEEALERVRANRKSVD
jgi:hypothetical protein